MSTYNTEKMKELLRDFYNLTGMKMCIYDRAGNEICYYPEKLSVFCALLRTDEELAKRCVECDRRAFSVCKRTREQYSYTCHAGLLECVSPVVHDGETVGYIVIGQIKPNDSGGFCDAAEYMPHDLRERLRRAYEDLPAIEMEKIRSAMHILDACTGYEYLKSLIRTGEDLIDAKLDTYISRHLEDDLSVGTLARVFRLSHSEIYIIFKECFHSTPAEYVRSRRLGYACELLTRTALPISEIAKRAGISDYNYFSKLFKARFGISPREYRRAKK